MESPAKEKSEAFAVRFVNLYKHLVDTYKDYTIPKQVLRSGTGIVANLAEAECAISKKGLHCKSLYRAERMFGNQILVKTALRDGVY